MYINYPLFFLLLLLLDEPEDELLDVCPELLLPEEAPAFFPAFFPFVIKNTPLY